MKEIEVKAKVVDFAHITSQLKNLGCTFSQTLVQKDRIYLSTSLEFSDITRGSTILRIRDSNGIITMTLKKQVENELDNIEEEVIINDANKAHEMFINMDFHEVMSVTKKRIKCKYNDLEICLDEVEGLGSFIEVEKLCEDEEGLQVQKELFAFLETLGIQKEDQVFKGYDTLLYELQNR